MDVPLIAGIADDDGEHRGSKANTISARVATEVRSTQRQAMADATRKVCRTTGLSHARICAAKRPAAEVRRPGSAIKNWIRSTRVPSRGQPSPAARVTRLARYGPCKARRNCGKPIPILEFFQRAAKPPFAPGGNAKPLMNLWSIPDAFRCVLGRNENPASACAKKFAPPRSARHNSRMSAFDFPPFDLPSEAVALRGEVRAFPGRTHAILFPPPKKHGRGWAATPLLTQNGWSVAGLARHGQRSMAGASGAIRTLCRDKRRCSAAGAPVSAHWIADRQSGPLLLRFGTEEQRQTSVAADRKGRMLLLHWDERAGIRLRSCERAHPRLPQSGSAAGGVSGQKIWTSGAHEAHYTIALVRTQDARAPRRPPAQLIVDMKSEGADRPSDRDTDRRRSF